MDIVIITNNKKVYEMFKDKYLVEYEDITYKEILIKVRNKVHEGHEVLTHPLASSVKPNETPFKSIIISKKKGKLNYNSLMVIENSIATYEKFLKLKVEWTDAVLDDFRTIDLTMIKSALSKN